MLMVLMIIALICALVVFYAMNKFGAFKDEIDDEDDNKKGPK